MGHDEARVEPYARRRCSRGGIAMRELGNSVFSFSIGGLFRDYSSFEIHRDGDAYSYHHKSHFTRTRKSTGGRWTRRR